MIIFERSTRRHLGWLHNSGRIERYSGLHEHAAVDGRSGFELCQGSTEDDPLEVRSGAKDAPTCDNPNDVFGFSAVYQDDLLSVVHGHVSCDLEDPRVLGGALEGGVPSEPDTRAELIQAREKGCTPKCARLVFNEVGSGAAGSVSVGGLNVWRWSFSHRWGRCRWRPTAIR